MINIGVIAFQVARPHQLLRQTIFYRFIYKDLHHNLHPAKINLARIQMAHFWLVTGKWRRIWILLELIWKSSKQSRLQMYFHWRKAHRRQGSAFPVRSKHHYRSTWNTFIIIIIVIVAEQNIYLYWWSDASIHIVRRRESLWQKSILRNSLDCFSTKHRNTRRTLTAKIEDSISFPVRNWHKTYATPFSGEKWKFLFEKFNQIIKRRFTHFRT